MSSGFCAKCGHPYESDADRFCASCGTPRVKNAGGPDANEAVRAQVGRSVRASMGLAIACVLVPLFFVLFVFGVFGNPFGSSVEGSVKVAGPAGGFTFVPTGCDSMQPFGHAGANIHGDGNNDGGVYVTVDPLVGTKVDVEIPGSCKNADGSECTLFTVPRDRCTQWDVDAHFTGTVVNDVRQYAGHALLSCVLDDGTVVEADLHYSGC